MDLSAQIERRIERAAPIIAPEDPLARDVNAIAGIGAVPLILDVICRTTGMGFAAVARVTEARWVACAVKDGIGFPIRPGDDIPVELTVCNDIRCSGRPVVIGDLPEDTRYRNHPGLTGQGFQSYISMPIRRPRGEFFGTLCAVDRRARFLNTPHVIGMFELFADLIGFYLDARDRLAASQTALLDARETAQLRDQFISVLGHDLRNPLASLEAGVRLIEQAPPPEVAGATLTLMREASRRMAGLIDNVIDFARGRLGGGLALSRKEGLLGPVLRKSLADLEVAWPGRSIRTEIDVPGAIDCDPGRIGQLLSILVNNALSHGAPEEAVRVEASTDDGRFVLTVTNVGETIPPDIQRRLFQPFYRQAAEGPGLGLGLGLFIAAEIARVHEGQLTVSSHEGETRFTFTMPA